MCCWEGWWLALQTYSQWLWLNITEIESANGTRESFNFIKLNRMKLTVTFGQAIMEPLLTHYKLSGIMDHC